MTLPITLLLLLSALAFFRPVFGLGILLVLTSSLFNLDALATVALPIGYIAPTEAMLCAILLRWILVVLPADPSPVSVQHRQLARQVAWAFVPYLLWQTLCASRGLYLWSGTEHFRFAFRFLLSGVLPYLVPLLIFRLTRRTAGLFRWALYIALATAVVHLFFQVTDYRDLISAAYIRRPDNSEYSFVYDSMTQAISSATFVRVLPQGMFLMLFFAVYLITRFFVDGKRSRASLIYGIVIIAAIFSTLTRSLMFSVFAGVLFGLFYARRYDLVKAGTAMRVCIFAGVLVTGFVAYDYVRPDIVPEWMNRLEALSGPEGNAFDPANQARGLDNLSSLNAIADHPLLGVGTSRHPKEYSFRAVPPTDIHPTLQAGLVGGIPGMLLSLSMELLIIGAFMGRARRNPALARGLTPILAVLAMNALVVNTIGAGGTLLGNGTLAVVVFVIEGCRLCMAEAPYAAPAAATAANPGRIFYRDRILRPC